jgi:GNAT superfamily N-acetyltransferase
MTPEFPTSWEVNKVALEPGARPADVGRAISLAEERFGAFAHRRVSVPDPAAEVVAPDGWQIETLLAMRWDGPAPDRPAGVEDITPDELFAARVHAGAPAEWARIQTPFDAGPGTRPLALLEDGEIRAWCVIHGGGIDDVYVLPPHRGRGLGRAISVAAVAAGGWFLTCDAADPRPQGLYRSLGFVDAGRLVHLTRRYVAAP